MIIDSSVLLDGSSNTPALQLECCIPEWYKYHVHGKEGVIGRERMHSRCETPGPKKFGRVYHAPVQKHT